ncbi:hypothetical protein V5799_005109 [Amblyomma americanum]|uniref:Uncharacterized protein n=1 Tax=Amblyomma americanum TaxID=6943 RepID=A0AAQ4E077_AMBAM
MQRRRAAEPRRFSPVYWPLPSATLSHLRQTAGALVLYFYAFTTTPEATAASPASTCDDVGGEAFRKALPQRAAAAVAAAGELGYPRDGVDDRSASRFRGHSFRSQSRVLGYSCRRSRRSGIAEYLYDDVDNRGSVRHHYHEPQRLLRQSMAPSDKQELLRARVRYPSYLNMLLFAGTMSACLGVVLCSYHLVYAADPVIWISGLVAFGVGVFLALLALGLLAASLMRRQTLEASWVPQSVSPYEEDFGTDYYFDDADDAGRVYRPTTYAAPKLLVSNPLAAPVAASVYRLVYGADPK